jgi:hypothetical protein
MEANKKLETGDTFMPGPVDPPVPGPAPAPPEVLPDEDEPVGLFGAITLIFIAVARNIEEAGIVEMTNMFRMFFRSFLATILVIGGGYFLYRVALTFESDTVKLNEYVGVIIGFVAGFLTAAIGFYFGGQDRKQKPLEEQLRDIQP